MPSLRDRDSRILSLWLPSLPTDRLARPVRSGRRGRSAAAGRPVVVAEKINNALRLSAVNAAAAALGLGAGMPLADARAIAGSVAVHPADPAADLKLLNHIADWCDRYTPLVALDAPDLTGDGEAPAPGAGLFLDISGCAHLFGGEQGLRADLLSRLAGRGFQASAAIAATAGAAWALARFGDPDAQAAFIARGAERDLLAELPVAALRLSDAQLALLDRLGLKRVGQLAGQPRAPFSTRFGAGLLRRLDQALGHEDEPLSPRRPVPMLSAERRFAEPVSGADSVAATIRVLAGRLGPVLEARGVGAQMVELSLFRTDGEVIRAAVGTARPIRDPATIVALFRERLDAVGETFDTAHDVFNAGGHGFDMMRLCVVEAETRDAVQTDLAGGAKQDDDFEALVDRLGARLGLARIARPLRVESHIPERAVTMQPPGRAGAGMTAAAWVMPDGRMETPPERPLRLFARPERIEVVAGLPGGPPLRFRWRRALYDVAAAEGPERIAPEWWRAPAGGGEVRDYYRIEDGDGRRYWVYRAEPWTGGPGGSAGSPGTGDPAWYLHGLFA